ncbi:hypothetical protein F5Y01DRAFT_275770 [Xylaria sp. FL0043]|nr:hypothetical protein F5Y01DRAFT_275770 [Xylaria sp. FL0043]
MLRQLRSWCRSMPRSLTSTDSFFRSSRPQPSLKWQRHFFSQPGIPRHGPRTHQYRQHGSSSRHLHAGIHCSIFTSIGALALSGETDWEVARARAIRLIGHIILEKDPEERWHTLCMMIAWSLASFCETDFDHLGYHNHPIRVPAFVQTTIMTAPDPEVEGGTLVVCVGMIEDIEDTYLIENGDRLTDLAQTSIPQVEAFASKLEASPKVRGAMVLLDPGGNWKSLYWDGRRWINVVFLEWQTPESMASLFS